MLHRSPPAGPRFSLQEARLCRKEGPLDVIGARIESLDQGLRSFFTSVFDKLSGANMDQETRSAMQDPSQWVEGFRHALIVEHDKQAVDHPKGKFGPREYLLSLSLEARKVEFVRFLHAQIPEKIRKANPPHKLFKTVSVAPPAIGTTIAALTAPNLETYLGVGKLATDEINAQLRDQEIQDLLDAQMLMMGEKAAPVSRDKEVKDLAQLSVQEFYPAGDIGHLFADYTIAVRQIIATAKRNGTPEPTPEQLRSVAYLIDNVPSGRLRGWLRIRNDIDADGTRRRIADIAGMREKQEQEELIVIDRSRKDLQRLHEAPRKRLQNANRTPWENFERFEPWQQAAIGALAFYGVWKLWKSEGKFLGLLPYSLVPPALLGTYLYMRVVQGDEEAFNKMLMTGQKGANILGEGAKSLLRNMGVDGGPHAEQFDKQMETMRRFFREQAFEKAYPGSVAFATLSEAKMENIAGAMSIRNQGRFTFSAPPGSLLQLELDGIIKRRGYDSRAVYTYLQNSNKGTNPELTRAMTSFFFVLGARDPAHQGTARKIEAARRSRGSAANPSPSYFDITDPVLQREFFTIVARGQVLGGQPPLSRMTFGEVVNQLTKSNEAERYQVDTAHNVPDLLETADRKEERALYAHSNEVIKDEVSLEKERDTLRDKMRASFKEWCETMEKRGILSNKANNVLIPRFTDISGLIGAPHNKPVAEVALALERLKYYVLAAAHGQSTLPVNAEVIDTHVLPKMGQPVGWLERLLASGKEILESLNRTLIMVDGRFGEIMSLDDLHVMLNTKSFRTFGPLKSLNAQGFEFLQQRVKFYRKKFDNMRDDGNIAFGIGAHNSNVGRAAERIVASNKDWVGANKRFLSREKAIEATMTALRANPRGDKTFANRIDAREKLFATQVGTEILMAFLTDHRSDGNHQLSPLLADRVFSPTETRNVDRFMGTLYNQTMGDLEDDLTAGYYGRLENVDTLHAALLIDVKQIQKMGEDTVKNGTELQSHAVTVMRAYALINRGVNNNLADGKEVHQALQERMLWIAYQFEKAWYERYPQGGKKLTDGTNAPKPPAGEPHRGELVDTKPYREKNLEIIVHGLQMLDAKRNPAKQKVPGPPADAHPKTYMANSDLTESIEHIKDERL